MTTAAATQFLPVIATAAAPRDGLVVSVHDVAPCNRPVVASILTELAKHGIKTCSLLVVPDYHRSNPIAEDPAFLGWLRQLEAEGHEVVIHGYFHTRPRAAHEGMMARLITRSYTQDEGEFYDLDYEEALRRIKAAYEIFAAARLKPRGFIAPAWLLNREGERAARDAGMEYTTRLGTVTDLRNGRQYRARSMVYSVRNQWRRAASLAWNGALFAMTRQAPLVRLSLHPPDFSCPGVWRQIEKFVVALAKTRTATTYQEWIAEERVRTSDDT